MLFYNSLRIVKRIIYTYKQLTDESNMKAKILIDFILIRLSVHFNYSQVVKSSQVLNS